MQTKLLKVVGQTDPIYVKTKKGDEAKSTIRLREPGGDYEDEYLCTLWGNAALLKYPVGNLVSAALRFRINENGYQDITANDIILLS